MKLFITVPLLFLYIQVKTQSSWNQSLHYDIRAKLNASEKSIDASMTLEYENHSPDTLKFIWFHVWPNAYRNDRTDYSEQILENGDTRFYFSSKEQKGYLNRLEFRINNVPAIIQDHPQFLDVVKVLLPKPLLPGERIIILSSFHIRIPYNFNGNGYLAHHFELKNWYPEPAVYDKAGWHPMPFLIQGGAYHEAAEFNVIIAAPSSYKIAAAAVADTLSKSTNEYSYQFHIPMANSFSWIADNRFQLIKDSINITPQTKIQLQLFVLPGKTQKMHYLINTISRQIQNISQTLVDYPYSVLTIVEESDLKDQQFSGIISIHPAPSGLYDSMTVYKALVGQWFKTVLLTDERYIPWFSKGFIEYYYQRLISSQTSKTNHFPNENLWLRVAESEKTTQPVSEPSPSFSVSNDSLMAGNKAALWFKNLEDSLGKKQFDKNMSVYFSTWKFKHPFPEDFKNAMEEGTSYDLSRDLEKLNGVESLFPPYVHKTTKPVFLFSARHTEKYNYIGIAPVPGYNRYDGFMMGVLFHNLNLPENPFEFLAIPMYGFESKNVAGLARLSYSWLPKKHFRKITVGLNAEKFDSDIATDSSGKYIFENFAKLVPYIRIDLTPKNARSTIRKWIDFKTFLIKENNFTDFRVASSDSLIHPNAISDAFRYVNQLSFNIENNRALYPYDLRIAFQQSELFYRINFTANYFLNYPAGGGLQVRFFSSKFGTWNTSNKTDVSRYEPKLLGVNGEEDYLYEDYFVGRSANNATLKSSVPNDGIYAQQIMNRDGGLKLRIDEYDFLQGKSENWVASINLSTSLPNHLFPIPIPLRLFFDFGTYAESWQENAPTSRFLYTGGIQLSLFKNVLNVYAPLIYSSDFNQAFSNTSFGKKITFSIDIQNIRYNKMIRKLADHE